MTSEEKRNKSLVVNGVMDYDYYKNLMFDEEIEEMALRAYPEPTAEGFAKRSFFKRGVIEGLKTNNFKIMANEDEKLESMNNADLAMEFLKKCQKCRETGVPNDMAILAALHDLADWKDTNSSKDMVRIEDAYNWIEQYASEYVGRSEYMASDFRKFMEERQ